MSDKIKNGDKPIAPVYYADGTIAHDNDKFFSCSLLQGLTKREYFAALAMQGLLANQSLPTHAYTQENYGNYYNGIAHTSVIEADNLLAELERTKNKQDE